MFIKELLTNMLLFRKFVKNYLEFITWRWSLLILWCFYLYCLVFMCIYIHTFIYTHIYNIDIICIYIYVYFSYKIRITCSIVSFFTSYFMSWNFPVSLYSYPWTTQGLRGDTYSSKSSPIPQFQKHQFFSA